MEGKKEPCGLEHVYKRYSNVIIFLSHHPRPLFSPDFFFFANEKTATDSNEKE